MKAKAMKSKSLTLSICLKVKSKVGSRRKGPQFNPYAWRSHRATTTGRNASSDRLFHRFDQTQKVPKQGIAERTVIGCRCCPAYHHDEIQALKVSAMKAEDITRQPF